MLQLLYARATGNKLLTEQFYTAKGAEALLQLRNGYQQLTKVQGLPQVVQLSLKLYEA